MQQSSSGQSRSPRAGKEKHCHLEKILADFRLRAQGRHTLPPHVSVVMNRYTQYREASPRPNGYGLGARMTGMGESGRSFSIQPDKYDRYHPRSSRSLMYRRRAMLTRLGGMITLALMVMMYFVPAARPGAVLGGVRSGLFSGGDEFSIETVRYYDLNTVEGTARGWERQERILLCAPLRDAAVHLPMFFSHLKNLTYPHNLIDLAFLVGDSRDNTLDLLSDLLAELQAAPDRKDAFGEISVIEKDFGQKVNQDVESRHGFAAQASRRKSMAQARNWLLSAALRPTHSWVYWRDVDLETAPFTILEDLMRHNKDVIVPSTFLEPHTSGQMLTRSRCLAASPRLARW